MLPPDDAAAAAVAGGGTGGRKRGGPRSDGAGVARSCESAFRAGARWFDGRATAVAGHIRKVERPTPVDRALHEVLWAAHAACHEPWATTAPPAPDRAAAAAAAAAAATAVSPAGALDAVDGQAKGGGDAAGPFSGWPVEPVRTVARRGSAVVFFHSHPNGAPDPFAWHAGCLPLSGDKWTLQKFKEMPVAFR